MKYYLIPVVEKDILCDGESLRDIFSREFPELAKREDERVDIIYSTRYFMPIPELKLRAHNHETKEMYAIPINNIIIVFIVLSMLLIPFSRATLS